jgi:amidase
MSTGSRLRLAIVLAALLLTAPAARAADATPAAVDLDRLSLIEGRAQLAAGQLSSEAWVQAALARIERNDRQGPELRAVLTLAPDALDVARQRDAERQTGQLRGPLHGVPVLVKDNLDTADLPTTAGSLALATHRPAADAFVVTRLREAGAVILGKANLSEWANFRSTESSSGWSSAGGQTRNPYDPTRSPCGSSSGTGAGVAAGYAPLGIGTETDGSIVCPSAANGLVGFKPSRGWVSRSGIIPIAEAQDTAGPMTTTVADAAALLAVISGPDPADPATTEVTIPPAPDAATFKTATLKGVRIGVLRQNLGFHPGVDAIFERELARLREAGAEIVDPVRIENLPKIGEAEFTVLLHEFRDGLNRYLTDSKAPVQSLAALIAWNREHAEQAMPWFAQELLERAEATGSLTEAYRTARADARRLAGPEGIDAALATHDLDVLIGPSNGPAWKIDHVNGDHYGGGSSRLPAVAGYPHLTVPMGYVHGLPVGLSIIGPANSDWRVLEIGAAYEKLNPARRAPGVK